MTVIQMFMSWLHVGEGEVVDDPVLSRRLDAAEREASTQFASMQDARRDMDRHSITRSDPPSVFDDMNNDIDAADDLMQRALSNGQGQES